MVVAGGGMAGLAAAARARELGLSPVVYEKGSPPGGSMLLSSCVIWRYRTLEAFRAECPHGHPELQRLVVERLDSALAWLQSLGAPVVRRETGNPETSGMRFDPGGLTNALARAGGELLLDTPLTALPDGVPTVLATGGFQGDRGLLRSYVTPEADGLLLRANPWSRGDGLRLGLGAGARLSAGLSEFYGRAMPGPPAHVPPNLFVLAAQLYARHARVESDEGERYPPESITWSETDVVQWIARRPGARAWYVVPRERLGERIGERTVAQMVEAARATGGLVKERSGEVRVRVAAGITTTLGGLAVNTKAQLVGVDGRPIEGLYAAGADAGGISAGGYSSGLAAALVLGMTAAEAIAGRA